jgi:hypothetical protein
VNINAKKKEQENEIEKGEKKLNEIKRKTE